MGQLAAVRVAVDLLHLPSRARALKCGPLPDGLEMLLRIAAGDEEIVAAAAKSTNRPHEVLRNACAFFIEQILLSPQSDSYRVLGASPQSTTAELRRNMALLVKWMHPDLATSGERALFAGRVTGACDDLKTPERRAAYDNGRLRVPENAASARKKSGGRRTPKRASRKRPAGRLESKFPCDGEAGTGLLRRAVWFLLGRSKV
jgi:hypothetical protein